ncbi:TonB-linked SusC/RagA family outer membrane protein [Arcicella aurantiaca]|uniref:TonB-linked SusC/RagA family outer membrane protein n=1 Tax=Arcicella aurantiaca TaxID=591202 RepID=A0A316EDG0_9BACT|nr:SusC/RagA family TonB-linked outer membrane protein [Arcicella aurantiaca]PWK27683.1 TonB-linked SusC/RagA family outer membrane protein [Arcicella aurantiaca]
MRNILQFTFRGIVVRIFQQIFFTILLLTFSLNAFSQERIITGKVIDGADKKPVAGATVRIKGTEKGTSTNAEGTFKIAVNDNAILQFSFIGFSSQEVQTGSKSIINVVLNEDIKQVEEVVVTALGISKERRSLTNAIQTVKGADLIKAREPNPINSLAGKVAGLTIGASAELLGRPNVVLRGNTDVLYVVDGVPINSDTWNISADDIETYSVLKGANAAALYGFRGKNGAILITTKKGSKDKRGFSVEFNSSTMIESGFNAIPKVQDLYGPGDHGQYSFVDGKGGGNNDGDYDIWGPKFDPTGAKKIAQYDSPIDPLTGKRIPTAWTARGANNLTRFLRDGVLANNNIAISSTTEKADVRFSLSNNYQKGIVPNTQLNVTNFSVNAGVNFSKKLRLETNLNYNRQATPNIPDVNYGPNSLIYNMVIWGGADWSVDDMRNYWQAGKEGVQQIYAEYQRYNNPYFVANEWLRSHYKNDVYGYASLDYKINDNFSVMGRTSVTTYDIFRSEKFPYSATVYGREEGKGDYREDKRTLFENNTDILIKYNQKFNNAFDVKIWGGGNIRSFKYNSSYVTTDYLNTPGVYTFANSLRPVKAFSYLADMEVQSGYYSADFSYKGLVTFSTTGRVDRLSTLPAGNNTFFYPSFGLTTVVSDYVTLPEQISLVKLRASYANVKDGLTRSTIGTNPSGSYALGYGSEYASSYDGPNYANSVGYGIFPSYNNGPGAAYSDKINNPALKPNSTEQIELGLEVSLLKNRFSADVTYFTSNDGPRIFNRDLSQTTGYTSAIVNGIKTKKTGLEVSLKGSPIKTNDFSWDVLLNVSNFKETLQEVYNENNVKIESLPSNYFVSGNVSTQFIHVGERIDQVYVATYLRTTDGQIINDAGGRPIVNSRGTMVGYANPDYVWGLNNKVSYKNWSLSFQFDGRVGGTVEDYIRKQTFRGGRHIETVEGAFGAARDFDAQGVKAYVGEGVMITEGTPTFDSNTGLITNMSSLKFATNTIKTYAQDYISRYNGTAEGNLMSKTFSKLREVTVSYNFPSSMLAKTFIKQASISLVGRNLFYFVDSKHSGVDLDQFTGLSASTGLQTPTMKRFGINLNITF